MELMEILIVICSCEQVCKPKDKGRLGIGNICLKNKALMVKLWWRGYVEGEP